MRSPQDTAVSQYFQWKHRMRPAKKGLNDYPEHGADVSVFDFVMRPGAGLPKIIDFMNLWAAETPHAARVPAGPLRGHAARSGRRSCAASSASSAARRTRRALRHAVEFASVENMRAMEQRNVFWLSGGRMTPRDRSNPDSFKVRRAKVGGYRDYFDDEQVARIDELVRSKLSPLFGYGGDASPQRRARGIAS